MKKFLDELAGRTYLEFLVATNFPEQEPEYKNARWHDLLWLFIPIIGIIGFIQSIKTRKP